MNTPFDSVEAAIEDIRNGKMVIVTDDANRENEGDLVCAAEKVTPEDIVFMATHARGLICTPITEARANELGIARPPSTDMFHTAFTESVDSKIGTTLIRNARLPILHIPVTPSPSRHAPAACSRERVTPKRPSISRGSPDSNPRA